MSKISAYGAYTSVSSSDLLAVVDVSDTTMASSGTTKKMTLSQLPGSTNAWQFTPENYGGTGDGKIGTGGTGTSGTSTFTDSGASFVNATAPAGDVGKVIVINQGTSGSGTQFGTSQNPFCGTISAVNSATSVTLSANLGATCTAAPYVFGTDNSAAIASALSAAATWAEANNWECEISFGPYIYMLKALTQSTSPVHYNSHIALPYGPQTGQRLVIKMIGSGEPQCDYWEAEAPQLNGTCLVSGIFPGSQPDGTYGQVSIIGSTTQQDFGGTTFAGTRLVLDNITLAAPWNSPIYGVDGRYIGQMIIPRGYFRAFTPVNVPGASIGGPYTQRIPTTTSSVGFAYPIRGNNTANIGGEITAETVAFGVTCAEHTSFWRLTALYNQSGCYLTDTASVTHGVTIQHFCCEGANISLDAAGVSTGNFPIFIGLMDNEVLNTSHINDPNNMLVGVVHCEPAGPGTQWWRAGRS